MTEGFTYICAACGSERDFTEVVAAANPTGAGWYCRDAAACAEAVRRG